MRTIPRDTISENSPMRLSDGDDSVL
jgi:hypothetical protein